MPDFNTIQVEKTLRLLVGILDKHDVEYRIFGSMIPAALNSALHREIADFDLLIDRDKLDLVIDDLREAGFKKKVKSYWRASEWVSMYIFIHEELLETGFFAVDFGDKQVVFDAGPFKITVDSSAVKRASYTLGGINFVGIPADTAYTGALISKPNPKRVREFEIFERCGVQARPNDYVNVYLGKLKISWTLDLLNSLFNVIGKIRVKMGKTYDIWR